MIHSITSSTSDVDRGKEQKGEGKQHSVTVGFFLVKAGLVVLEMDELWDWRSVSSIGAIFRNLRTNSSVHTLNPFGFAYLYAWVRKLKSEGRQTRKCIAIRTTWSTHTMFCLLHSTLSMCFMIVSSPSFLSVGPQRTILYPVHLIIIDLDSAFKLPLQGLQI